MKTIGATTLTMKITMRTVDILSSFRTGMSVYSRSCGELSYPDELLRNLSNTVLYFAASVTSIECSVLKLSHSLYILQCSTIGKEEPSPNILCL
jgi:hypothetical protein